MPLSLALLSPSTRVRCNSDIIAAGIAGQTVLLNPNDWTYVHCNETAARIWETLGEPRNVANVVETLMRDYAIDRATCEREVAEFVLEMSRRGFVIIDAPS